MLRSLIALFCFLLAACSQERAPLRVWSHYGSEAEEIALQELARDFERTATPSTRIDLSFFPESRYNEKLEAAATAGILPDVFELDGPTVAKWSASGLLAKLDGFLRDNDRVDFLPTVLEQGTVGGSLYALGSSESAVVLYYDRTLFDRAGVTAPKAGEAWTWDELVDAARRLRSPGVAPIALHMNHADDEWLTYAFSPILWSAGGALISTDGRTVAGVLDSDVNVGALERFQSLFREGLADANPVDADPFGSGKSAIDWSSHAMAKDHVAKKGETLGAMPLPRLGKLSVAPSGSWCWAISSRSTQPGPAFAWLRTLVDPAPGVRTLADASGDLPSRRSAFAQSPELQQAPFSIFREQLELRARPRPRTVHYAVLTQHFASAVRDIAAGANVRDRLARSAAIIQSEIDRAEASSLRMHAN